MAGAYASGKSPAQPGAQAGEGTALCPLPERELAEHAPLARPPFATHPGQP
jgi:hypothetical protein